MTISPEKHIAIHKALARVALDHDITILMAVESGSRAWGFASTNSDYDVRFIYKRYTSDYLSLAYHSDLEVIEQKLPGDLDLSGWDVRKALKLASMSNPSIAEWSRSPIEYRNLGFFRSALSSLIEEHYDIETAIRAYHSMARGNYNKYIKDRLSIVYKRLLYVVRPLVAVRWLKEYGTIPPVVLRDMLDLLPYDTAGEVITMIVTKSGGHELGSGAFEDYPLIKAFIERDIIDIPGPRPEFSATCESTLAFDDLLQRVLSDRL